MAAIGDAGNRTMHGGAERGGPPVRQAGDHELRSEQPIHVHRLHQGAEGRGHQDQHGRKGAWRDNVFVERTWRSVKYEEDYLHAYDSVSPPEAGLPDT